MHLSVLGDFHFTIHIGYVELTFIVNLFPFKFTPFDTLFRLDALHPTRYCSGLDWKVRAFMAQLMVEWRVYECNWGLAGILTENDARDCQWKNYVPQLPIFELLWDTPGNQEGSYIDTACSNWYSASWENFPISTDYLQKIAESGQLGNLDAKDAAIDEDNAYI